MKDWNTREALVAVGCLACLLGFIVFCNMHENLLMISGGIACIAIGIALIASIYFMLKTGRFSYVGLMDQAHQSTRADRRADFWFMVAAKTGLALLSIACGVLLLRS